MPHVRVRLNLQGVRFEYEGTEALFERCFDPWVEAAARRQGPGSAPRAVRERAPEENGAEAGDRHESEPSAVAASSGYRPPSYEFGTFVRQLGPEASEADRQVVAFAFFLWNYEKKDVFREDEVEGCFRALGLAVPEDLSDICHDLAERRRFLDATEEEGVWALNQKGKNYVKTRLFGGA